MESNETSDCTLGLKIIRSIVVRWNNNGIQTDCYGDTVLCNGQPCGTWECGLVGEPGHQQKVCFGRCSSTGIPSGSRECSCLRQLGPIQIGTTCTWKVKSEPQCSPVRTPPIKTSGISAYRESPYIPNVRSFRQSYREQAEATTTTDFYTS